MALTGKQALFIEEYLKCNNATDAAEKAGYKGDRTVLASVGWENLRKPEISEAISQRTAETAMSADEVLMRLADHGRGNMGDFWNIPDSGIPSLNLLSDKAKLNLIKKMKVKTTKRFISVKDEDPTIEETTEIDFELYDAQAALEKLGRHHKLFTDKSELSGPDGGPIEHADVELTDAERASRVSALLDRARARRTGLSIIDGSGDMETITGATK